MEITKVLKKFHPDSIDEILIKNYDEAEKNFRRDINAKIPFEPNDIITSLVPTWIVYTLYLFFLFLCSITIRLTYVAILGILGISFLSLLFLGFARIKNLF